MSFFQQLADLQLVGDVKLAIKTMPDKMIVSVLVDNEKCGDNARKAIPPLVLTGTAAELDEGFFTHVAEPMQQSSGLQVNMEAYLKGKEVAEKQSKMETDKAEKLRKETEAKKKVYDEAMKKVDDLVKEKKYKEALTKLPKHTDHPGQAEVIKIKRDSIVKLMTGTGSLFDAPAEDTPAQPASLTTGDDEEADNPGEDSDDDEDNDDDQDEDLNDENND